MLGAAALLLVAALASTATAEDASQHACLEAHGQGQDERDQGHVALARRFFTTCAQPTCPALVQDDCARLADELERVQPSISFLARDADGNDLPDTSVFVDGVLLLTQLDGMWHDIDPGMHVVRFERGGRQQDVSVVVGSGEKGRAVVGTFEVLPPSNAREPAPTRALLNGPLIAIGASAALVALGGTLLVVGLARVPDNCTLSKHECAGPPGDKSLHEASRAVRLSNVGWAGAGLGLAALGASIFWYFHSEKTNARARHALMPFASVRGGGVSLSGSM